MTDVSVVAAMPGFFYVGESTLTKQKVLARKPRIFGKTEWTIARTRVAEVELMLVLDLLDLNDEQVKSWARLYMMLGVKQYLDDAVSRSFAEYKTVETHDSIGIAA